MDEMKFSKETQLEIVKPIFKEIMKNGLIELIDGILKESQKNNPVISNLTDNEIKKMLFESIEESIIELKETMKKPKKFWNK